MDFIHSLLSLEIQGNIGEPQRNSGKSPQKSREVQGNSGNDFIQNLQPTLFEISFIVNSPLQHSFNQEWLEIWDSNLDVQIALDMYAIVTYITDYYLKVRNSNH